MRGIASFCGTVADFKLYLLAMRTWLQWERGYRQRRKAASQ